MGGPRVSPGRPGCNARRVLSSCILSSPPKENLAELRRFSLEAGETIFHQGVPAAGLHILCEGYVKLSVQDAVGKEAPY